ncbi:MAG: DUF1349 domain-containing protein [Candidatus Bathyarchaeota archaeon]|nr:DUF1349 domain-containing protein [Candidatus Bathyarchaeota archaeon]
MLAASISFAGASPGYIDEFTESTLLPFWTFVDPTGNSSYSLTANAGWLRITAPTGVALAPTSNYNASRVLQSVTSDFVATTCVTGSFTQSGFRGGILVWKDTSNYMRLEKWGTNQVLMYGVLDGTVTYQAGTLPSTYNPLHLKLERSGTTLRGYWSENGTDGSWTLIKQFTSFTAGDSVEIGLFVINVGSTPFSADFDFFKIVPGSLFVVPEYPLGTIAIPIAMGAAVIIYKKRPGQKTKS